MGVTKTYMSYTYIKTSSQELNDFVEVFEENNCIMEVHENLTGEVCPSRNLPS